MKYYVQYMVEGRELLGSDGIFPLDARLSLVHMVERAQVQQQSLYNVKPQITGFKIMRGDLKRSWVIRGESFKAIRKVIIK